MNELVIPVRSDFLTFFSPSKVISEIGLSQYHSESSYCAKTNIVEKTRRTINTLFLRKFCIQISVTNQNENFQENDKVVAGTNC